jgi:hypothetical protein
MKRFILLCFSFSLLVCGRAQNITRLEYYIDTDPGFGSGHPVAITPGPEIQKNFTIDASGVQRGLHILGTRVRDANMNWSTTQHHLFLTIDYTMASNMVQAEYFLDDDPGYGNGIQIPFTPGPGLSLNVPLDPQQATPGFHMLYVRIKNDEGDWSTTSAIMAYFSSGAPLNITGLEYFIDQDPGFGNGRQVAITPGVEIFKVFNIETDTLAEGFHILFARARDAAGNWSMTGTVNFYSVPVNAYMNRMEYFIDNDPGFGNAVQITIPNSKNITKSFPINLTGLGAGKHVLYVRVKNRFNTWSVTAIDEFYLLNLKIALEGPFNTSTNLMNNDLYTGNVIPLSQPYNSIPGAVWYYPGTESVASIPNSNVVDWVLVQTRDAATAAQATTATIRENRPAFLLRNGDIKNLNGSVYLMFTADISQNLFVVVYHRNHLGIMSANPVPLTGTGAGTCNFRTSSAQVYGSTLGYKQLNTSTWGLISGDGNGSGQVNNSDKVDVWKLQAGSSGYKAGDFNLNRQVDNTDKITFWKPNSGKASQVPL